MKQYISTIGIVFVKIHNVAAKLLLCFDDTINERKNSKEDSTVEKRNYSNEIANVVKEYLEENDWHYSFDEERGMFEFGLEVGGKVQKIKYLISVAESDMLILGICPFGADRDDEKMMAQMSEFICRANFGLKSGCFEFDFRDGEIRYKSFIDCDEVLPSTAVVGNSIYCTAAMYKRYGAGFTSIIFAGSSAKDAIAMCE